MPANAEIILLCTDLIFTTRIVQTARALGVSVKTVLSADSVEAAVEPETRSLFVDLSNPARTTKEDLARLRLTLPATVTMLAYGSHVDIARLTAAKEAGCHPVLARSEFVQRLPELIGKSPQTNS